jgi:hypothetical protein
MSRIDTSCTDPHPERGEELALLAGGDLPPEEAALLEAHAEACPVCRELLAGLRESGAALALLVEDELAGDPAALSRVRARVREGVRAEAEREERDTLGAPPRWAMAAVLLVALVAAAVWLRSGSPPDPGRDTGPSREASREASPDPRADRPAERAPEAGASASAGAPPEAPSAGPPPAGTIASARPADGPDSIGPIDSIDPRDPAEPIGSTAGAPDEARPTGSGAEQEAAPQITIRVVSDDPDIVFYWLVEPEENRDEETVSS